MTDDMQGSKWWAGLAWLVPALVLYAAGLFYPLGITVARALDLGASGWADLFNNPLFGRAALNTAIDSVVITLITIVMAYAIAAAIWRSGPLMRAVLTTLVVITFLTTILVKIVAFNALLRDSGLLNVVLLSLKVIDAPLHMFPGRPAVIIGMIQFVLPFAVFPILAVMVRLDPRIEMAAQSLGATAPRVFAFIMLPLTWPGVVASALLVFVISTGFYVIPATLGTPRDQLVANVISLYALNLVDFKIASAVAVVLILVVGTLTVLYQRADSTSR